MHQWYIEICGKLLAVFKMSTVFLFTDQVTLLNMNPNPFNSIL